MFDVTGLDAFVPGHGVWLQVRQTPDVLTLAVFDDIIDLNTLLGIVITGSKHVKLRLFGSWALKYLGVTEVPMDTLVYLYDEEGERHLFGLIEDGKIDADLVFYYQNTPVFDTAPESSTPQRRLTVCYLKK